MTHRAIRSALPLVVAVSSAVALAVPATTSAASRRPVTAPSRHLDEVAAIAGADTVWRRALADAIEPEPGCEETLAPLRTWIGEQLAGVSPATIDVLATYGVFDWPYFWTLGGDQDASDEYFGTDGSYTIELRRRHRELQRFWAVQTDDVLLQAMHGEVIADDAKMTMLVEFLFGVDASEALGIVDTVQAAIEADPGMDYDFPLLTFNAYAFSGEIPGLGPIPDKIVMGDGLLAALADLGLGDVAPAFVVAHEFGHHVQAELGVYDDFEPSPEATRRTELMADAFAAYEVAHARGATLRAARLVDVATTAYDVGDCEIDDENHHGTPRQRTRAVEWGIGEALGTTPRAVVVPPPEMVTRFDLALPEIVAT